MPLAESARQLAISDIQSYLAEHEQKDLLRFLTCGSVDDGKSTLIGRLFYDCKLIYEDQLTALLRDSQIHGTTGGSFDPALFTDGLKAEREQGITIDVAYRYFSTNRRKFIIADCPGHEQYTRNMATGASHCNLAIILVDARNGITTQTRRHSFIISLLGIRHVVLAVNKMDLVQWSAEIFHNIHREYTDFASRLQFTDLHAIPIAALHGDNVVQRSQNMPWYEGPTLLSHLENVNISADRNLVDLRFPVQYVIRPNLEFRGYAGTIASGILRTGDEVMVVSSARRSRVRRILIGNKEVSHAQAPLAVTICLEDEIDISRGDVLAHPNNLPCYDTDVEAMLIWFDSSPSKTGAVYWAKIGTFTVPVTLTKLRYKTDVNSLRKIENPPNPGLEMNEIGRAHLTFHRPVAFDPYRKNPPLGSFILIDRLTNNTAAAGIILDSATADSRSALSRIHPASRNIQRESSLVLPNVKSSLTGLRPFTLWFTGLSGSGKSTIAKLLERRLAQFGYLSALLDGDNLRHGLCRDLGFTPPERSENLRRAAEVARLFNDNGILVITSFISPYQADRAIAREIIGPDRFLEIYISTPLHICEQRDVKGLYARARAGEIPFFTGISDPYEPPTNPHLTIPAHEWPPEESLRRILLLLRSHGAFLREAPQEPNI